LRFSHRLNEHVALSAGVTTGTALCSRSSLQRTRGLRLIGRRPEAEPSRLAQISLLQKKKKNTKTRYVAIKNRIVPFLRRNDSRGERRGNNTRPQKAEVKPELPASVPQTRRTSQLLQLYKKQTIRHAVGQLTDLHIY